MDFTQTIEATATDEAALQVQPAGGHVRSTGAVT